MIRGINPKYNRTGKITGTTIVILILFLSFMFDVDPPMLVEDEKDEDETVAVIDYSNAGGGSSGGSQKPSETPKEDAAPDKPTAAKDPVPEQTTQVEESPVNVTPSENSSKADGESTSQTPAHDFGGMFDGFGGGENGGEGEGTHGTGVGPGEGPGIGSGVGDGSGRLVLEEPKITNPTQEEGRVMLELIIDRDGNVTSVKVLKSHSWTTTNNPDLFEAAKKAAWKWKFNKDPDGAEKQELRKYIDFTLD